MLRRIRTASSLLLALALTTSVGACAGSKKGPGGKGKSQAQIDKEREAAAERARTASLIDLASKDLLSGRYMSAIRRGEEALAADASNPDGHTVLAAAHWRAGDFEASTASYRKALELDAKNYSASLGLARNLQAAGQHDEALTLADALLEDEAKDFTEAPCDEDGACEAGWCDNEAKTCRAPRQIGPRLVKLWSHYAQLDVDAGIATSEGIFVGGVGDESAQAQLPVATAYAEFLRALENSTEGLLTIEGDKGSSSLALDKGQSLKHALVIVGGEPVDAVISELQLEARVDPSVVKRLKLKPVGKVTPFAMADETDIVIVPEVAIGDLKIKNVPALVQDLAPYAVGETPGVILGRQVMGRVGSITFDFGKREVVVTKAADAPAGASELPVIFLDLRAYAVPAIPVGVDGADHKFWAWLGGVWTSGVGITKKAYLKSGHRPNELADPENAEAGLKAVYVRSLDMGDVKYEGLGGLVFVNTPADPGLQNIVDGTGFELGGYLNSTSFDGLRITYQLGQGKLFVEAPPAG